MTREASSDGTVGKALDVLDMVAALNRPVRFSELLGQNAFPRIAAGAAGAGEGEDEGGADKAGRGARLDRARADRGG